MIRNRYTFSRPLTESEATLLLMVIGWRKGSYVTTAGIPVIGCVAHPDDLADFLAEQRRQNHQGDKLDRLKVNLQPLTTVSPNQKGE